MIAIAGIILVVNLNVLPKSNGAADYAKGHENNRVRALKNCWRRRMGTSTVLSAMEWRQLSQLPTTSSVDICMPACELHKHERVSSGLSHLIKRVV